MTDYFETKGWHPGLINGEAETDADTIEDIRNYWRAGDNPTYIATKCGVSRKTVIRHTADMPAQRSAKRLTAFEISELLQGWGAL